MMIKKTILAFILLFALSVSSKTQAVNPVSDTYWQNLKTDGVNTFNGILHTYSAPARWQKKDWLTAGGVALGTFGLYLLDEKIRPGFVRQGAGVGPFIRDAAFYFGKPQYNYGLTALLYGYGWLTKNKKIRQTGVLLISSATAAGLIQSFSKTAAGRARPSAMLGSRAFDPFNSTPDFHSFPSGHTILAFTTAHALAKQTQNIWIKGGIYGLGLITPVSRLWENAHWFSDVALSMAISVFVVDSIYKYLQAGSDYNTGPRVSSIKWNLKVGPGTVGIMGTF